MKGWFDAFRHDGGPTLYDHANRTAVTGDVPTITLCVVFITLYLAFLIIFPGIRSQRFTTFTIVTLNLFIGAVILVGNIGSEWHVGVKQITSAYRAFSSEKIAADLGVHIGFNHVNISMRSFGTDNASKVDYNERFTWDGATDMSHQYANALHKGLPYPILTVAEYLSLDEEGFCWGRKYRMAGYFSGIALWWAFASWMLMNILLVVVPRYGAYAMMLTGGLMMLTNLLYYLLTPSRPLVIRFEDVILTLRYGWCFWLVLISGVLCTLVGLIISIIDVIFPHKFSTILEVDYDTPYDRHIIIEESHDTKRKKPKLEEPFSVAFGSKIFRRLSRRGERGSLKFGVDNPSMELEPPKSPWRYPHRTFSAPMRSESRKSTKSVNFRDQRVYGNTLHPSSAALATQMESSDVETAPDMHVDITAGEKSSQEPCVVISGHHDWQSDCSASSSSSSAASSVSGDEEVQRVQDLVTVLPAVDFQSQFRSSVLGVRRQNSQDSHLSRASSRLNDKPVDDDWNDMPGADKQQERKSKVSLSSRPGSGASTPSRKVSYEEDVVDMLDRSASYHRSGLATVSARISAAVDADRSIRRSMNEESHRVDMW